MENHLTNHFDYKCVSTASEFVSVIVDEQSLKVF